MKKIILTSFLLPTFFAAAPAFSADASDVTSVRQYNIQVKENGADVSRKALEAKARTEIQREAQLECAANGQGLKSFTAEATRLNFADLRKQSNTIIITPPGEKSAKPQEPVIGKSLYALFSAVVVCSGNAPESSQKSALIFKREGSRFYRPYVHHERGLLFLDVMHGAGCPLSPVSHEWSFTRGSDCDVLDARGQGSMCTLVMTERSSNSCEAASVTTLDIRLNDLEKVLPQGAKLSSYNRVIIKSNTMVPQEFVLRNGILF